MYNFNPFMYGQPQYQPQQANPVKSDIIWVNGLAGANAYQMMPNSSASLFDKNENLVYIKSTDGAGFATVKTYQLIEKVEPDVIETVYITKNEYTDLVKRLEKLERVGNDTVRTDETEGDAKAANV
jgi:hypothetical protein